MLYIIKEANTNLFKIGTANNVERRLAQLGTGNPRRLSEFRVWNFGSANSHELEQDLKYVFKTNNIYGTEWFELIPNELNIVCEYIDFIHADYPSQNDFRRYAKNRWGRFNSHRCKNLPDTLKEKIESLAWGNGENNRADYISPQEVYRIEWEVLIEQIYEKPNDLQELIDHHRARNAPSLSLKRFGD